jgi:YidC/Oxa1 family membrane protein insertase
MDRKSIIVLAFTALLFVTWPMLVNKIYPPIPVRQTNSPTLGTNRSLTGATISSAGTNLIAAATNSAALATNAPVGKEENIIIENELATYHFSSFGGGIKLIELKRYSAMVGCKADKLATNPPASLNRKAPLAMFTIQDNGGLVADNVFRLSTNGQMVRAEKTLTNGLLLVKEFQILTNYQIKLTTRWENPTAAPIMIPSRVMIIGTATPTGAYDELRTLGLDWYDGDKAHRTDRNYFEASGFIFKSAAKETYSGGSSNVQWAATHNRFFTTVVTPETNFVHQVIGQVVALPPPSPEEVAGDPRTIVKPSGIVGSIAFQEVTVPAGAAYAQNFHVYAGPKEYKTLQRLRNDVDLVMNLTGFFGWFAKILLIWMNGLYALGASYGWAIVIITVVLKLLFYPLTAASTRSMKRMSSLQPQMKEIQEKYKDDPQKMNQKLQAFMKENKINPLGSCLPILLTIPVFGGFWFMLNSAIELRGAQFLWACDLSAPDTLFVIPGLNIPINGFAIIMIVTMMWQSHMTPPSPGIDPAQQKMMRYMPLVIVPFIYNQAAGLTLYWSVQNLLSIIQMKLTKDKPQDPAKPVVGKPAPVAPAPRRKA